MPIRRLSRVPVVVLTGVENAGKTTLALALADAMGWDCLLEAARSDEVVRQGHEDHAHLSAMLTRFDQALHTRVQTAQHGVICDTGALVLDIWAQKLWGKPIEGTPAVMQKVDLHLLCHTLPVWEPDPLRTLPEFDDRLALQSEYHRRLVQSGQPFEALPAAPTMERLDTAVAFIQHHFSV
jgi:nicotinamide riboside kinase